MPDVDCAQDAAGVSAVDIGDPRPADLPSVQTVRLNACLATFVT
jgi:hypothetical protein